VIFFKLLRLEFLFKLTPDTKLQSKEERDGGRIDYKDRTIVLVCDNLDGIEKKENCFYWEDETPQIFLKSNSSSNKLQCK
jgi:hypothetical protein